MPPAIIDEPAKGLAGFQQGRGPGLITAPGGKRPCCRFRVTCCAAVVENVLERVEIGLIGFFRGKCFAENGTLRHDGIDAMIHGSDRYHRAPGAAVPPKCNSVAAVFGKRFGKSDGIPIPSTLDPGIDFLPGLPPLLAKLRWS